MIRRWLGWLFDRPQRASLTVPDPPQSMPSGAHLQPKRQKARDRYLAIAGRLKAATGITAHMEHKRVSGLAWLGTGRILAPPGITRRQLYVLAHECGHIVLHSKGARWKKPNHVIEHEAEVFAHRALRRYGLEVPAKSTMWARGYVAQCIRADRAKGIPICGWPKPSSMARGRLTHVCPALRLASPGALRENTFQASAHTDVRIRTSASGAAASSVEIGSALNGLQLIHAGHGM
jgi:hypothetical protein